MAQQYNLCWTTPWAFHDSVTHSYIDSNLQINPLCCCTTSYCSCMPVLTRVRGLLCGMDIICKRKSSANFASLKLISVIVGTSICISIYCTTITVCNVIWHFASTCLRVLVTYVTQPCFLATLHRSVQVQIFLSQFKVLLMNLNLKLETTQQKNGHG